LASQNCLKSRYFARNTTFEDFRSLMIVKIWIY